MPPHTPRLERIRLYPLKSFDGLEVSTAEVLAQGSLEWDRRYGLFDGEGGVINGKRCPEVHAVRLHWAFDGAGLGFAARRGSEVLNGRLPEDGERLQAWFAQVLGRAVELREDAAGGYPDDIEAHGPTLVATASLERVAAWFGEALEKTRRRFRANLEIGGVPAFWEDGLLGGAGESPGRARVGEVELLGLKPCVRCPVPTRDPDTGEADSGLPRLLSARREAELPAWAPRERFAPFYRLALNTGVAPNFEGGTLRVGDAVTVIRGRF